MLLLVRSGDRAKRDQSIKHQALTDTRSKVIGTEVSDGLAAGASDESQTVEADGPKRGRSRFGRLTVTGY